MVNNRCFFSTKKEPRKAYTLKGRTCLYKRLAKGEITPVREDRILEKNKKNLNFFFIIWLKALPIQEENKFQFQ